MTNNRQKDLGQFFTPEPVVEFIYEMVRPMLPPQPKIIDPACGEGIFLRFARDHGITAEHNLYGCDLDEHIVEKWVNLGIFPRRMHLYQHDGLYEDNSTPGVALDTFDLAIGNPPFGGQGVTDPRALENLHLWRDHVRRTGRVLRERQLTYLAGSEAEENLPQQFRRSKTPIEVLFLERFLQLVKPGTGQVAIILPDGIFANSKLRFVRNFLLRSSRIEVIVGLPRDTFRGMGTTAKTNVLFVRKLRYGEAMLDGLEVFVASTDLASTSSGVYSDFSTIFLAFKDFVASQPDMLPEGGV
ncbi:MAG: N-6 DNA methylase [Anaerolineae bacterium]